MEEIVGIAVIQGAPNFDKKRITIMREIFYNTILIEIQMYK